MAKTKLVAGEKIIFQCNHGNFRTIILSTVFAPIELYAHLSNRYTITNKRIKVRKGIFFTSERDVSISKIDSIDTKRNFINRLLRLITLGLHPEQGSVVINSQNSTMALKGVPNPEQVRQKISALLFEWNTSQLSSSKRHCANSYWINECIPPKEANRDQLESEEWCIYQSATKWTKKTNKRRFANLLVFIDGECSFCTKRNDTRANYDPDSKLSVLL